MSEEKKVAGIAPGGVEAALAPGTDASDIGASDVGAMDRWLLVGFVAALLAAIVIAGVVYQPMAPDPICARTEARCGDHSDPAAQ